MHCITCITWSSDERNNWCGELSFLSASAKKAFCLILIQILYVCSYMSAGHKTCREYTSQSNLHKPSKAQPITKIPLISKLSPSNTLPTTLLSQILMNFFSYSPSTENVMIESASLCWESIIAKALPESILSAEIALWRIIS